jgi:hypothetical protein
MTSTRYRAVAACIVAAFAAGAHADAVTEWNVKAGEILADARLGPPPANRLMATAQTAVYEAVNAITGRYPRGDIKIDAAAGASVEAAVAAANCAVFVKLVPSQQAAIDKAYQTALGAIADGAGKSSGIAVGQAAAAAVLAARSGDNAGAAESYRPHTTAGAYVPTVIPAAPQWPQRKPWLMSSAAQFRPAAPPALDSALWARDYNEIKAVGGKTGSLRSAEQTEIAAFWEATAPAIYHGVVRSVAEAGGRDATRNARLYAAVSQAMDDALIAVFDAKYHYNFWRPVTAIRNGDLDGNDATERDASWTPFIETPMHPEYPCAHCTVAGAVGTVLEAELGSGTAPVLTTTSPAVKGAARRWTRIDDFVDEVANARIYDGVHYRNSTEVGTAMGRQVGALAVAKFLRPTVAASTATAAPR